LGSTSRNMLSNLGGTMTLSKFWIQK
jgi:hypothetical protein